MTATRHHFQIPGELAGQRLDRCLAQLHPAWSRTRARRLIESGAVTVDGAPARTAAVAARAGARIEVVDPDPDPDLPTEPAAEDLPLAVVYEDDDLLVVDKPTGLPIHPAAGHPAGTLVNALLHHTPDLSRLGGAERPGIVHRLDKDTTGLLLVAKSDRAHQALTLAFRRRHVAKTYAAVCFGVPAGEELVIDAPIARHPGHRQRMAVREGGRTARTVVRLVEPFRGTALVAASPVTGRTHQIRVHLAHAGHALVGDPTYAGRQWRNLAGDAARRACRAFPRQALHAWRLRLTHPVSGEPLELEAPLPADLVALLAVLRQDGGGAPSDEGPR